MRLEIANNPNILIFAPAFYPLGNPEAYVNTNLVLAMIEAGWRIDVITMAGHTSFYPNNMDERECLEPITLTVTQPRKTYSNQIIATTQVFLRSGHIVGGGRWAVPAAKVAIRLIKERKHDFILSRVLPPMGHLAALIVAKETGIPWIANWNDPVPVQKFPESYELGRGRNAPMGLFTKRYFREVAELAAWHTFPCERLRSYISGYLPADISEKSSVVPHIAFNNCKDTEVKRSGFTLMHAGSLLLPRSPHVFFKGIKLFRERVNPCQKFSVVFIVNRPDEVRQAAKDSDVEDLVRIESSRPYSEMPSILCQADVLVIIEAQTDEGIFLPSKFVDYVQTGRPILALSPVIGTLADVLKLNGGGIAVDGRSAEDVANALSLLYEHWLRGTLDKEFSSKKLYTLYAKETILNTYNNIFTRIRNRG